MSDETAELHIAIQGDETPLDQALKRGLARLDAFVEGVQARSQKINVSLNQFLMATAAGANRLTEAVGGVLTPITQAAAAIDKTANATDRSAASVSRLNREYKSGALTLEDYSAALLHVAETAAVGSEAQISALTQIREMQERVTEEAERDAVRRATAAKRAALEEAQAAKQASQAAKQASQRQDRGEKSVVRGIGVAGDAATMGVTVPALFAGVDAVKAASDLNETISKTTIVFGDNSTAMQKWSDTSAQAFGMSKRNALEGASTFGNFFNELGIGQQKSADMSRSLVQLAGNMASFHNMDPHEVLEKFMSGLNGMPRPLRQFGIDISAAALQTEAFKLGLTKVDPTKLTSAQFKVGEATMKLKEAVEKYGEGSYQAMRAQDALSRAQANLTKTASGSHAELTLGQKALAAYTLIMQHSKAAQDDYRRTADQEANSRRRLIATIEDTAAAYGKVLLPAVAEAEHALEGLFKALESLSDEQKQDILWWIEIAAAIGPALKLLQGVGAAFIFVGKSVQFLGTLPALIEGIAAKLGILEGAATGAAAAETGVAEAGIAAFAAGGPLAIALALITAAVVGIAFAWHKVKQAQDEATQSAANYADAQKEMSARGPRHALQVQMINVASQRSDVQDQLDKVNKDISFLPKTKTAEDLMKESGRDIPKERTDLANKAKDLQAQKDALDKQYNDLKSRYNKMPLDKKPAAPDTTPGVDPLFDPFAGVPTVPEPTGTTKMPRLPGLGSPLPDLDRMQALSRGYGRVKAMTSPEGLSNLPTDVDTYGAKLAASEDQLSAAFEQIEAKAAAAGQPLDSLAVKQDEAAASADSYRQRVALANNAIANATAAMKAHGEAADALVGRYDAAKKAYEEYHASLEKKAKSGQKITPEETRKDAELHRAATEVLASWREENDLAGRNADLVLKAKADRVAGARQVLALEGQIAHLQAESLTAQDKFAKGRFQRGADSREQYESYLSSQLADPNLDQGGPRFAALSGEMERLQQASAMVKQLQRETAALTPRSDFDQRRDDLSDKIALLKAQAKGDQEALAAISAYETAASAAIDRAQSTQATADAVQALKDRLDEGQIGLMAYRNGIEALRESLQKGTEEYRKLDNAVAEADKKIRDSNKRTADGIAQTYTDAFMRIAKGEESVGKVLSDSLKKAAESALSNFVKNSVSKLIQDYLNAHSKKQEQTAEQKALAAAEVQSKAMDTFVSGVNVLNGVISSFVSGVQDFAEAVNGGGTDSVTGAGGNSFADTVNALSNFGGAGIGSGGNRTVQDAAADVVVVSSATRSVKDAAASGSAAGAEMAGAALLTQAGKLTKSAGLGQGGDLLAGLGQASKGNVGGTLSSIAASGLIKGAVGAALPWLGIGLGVASLIGGLFGHQKPDYTNITRKSDYSQIGTGDHTGLIDSGYSGVEGMRTLQKSNAASRNGAASTGNQILNIHPNAIAIYAQPNHSVDAIADAVMARISDHAALDNALRGTD